MEIFCARRGFAWAYNADVRALSQVEYTASELTDALEFKVVRTEGWLEKVLAPLVAIMMIWMFWRIGHGIAAMFAGLSTAVYFLANWLHGSETRLRVTPDVLIAEGNLRKVFRTELRLSATEINSLRFDSGGEGGESGLYAKLDWGRRLVLPDVSEQQVEEIRDKIAARFPYFPVGERFGKESGLITLGLSKPRPIDIDSELRS